MTLNIIKLIGIFLIFDGLISYLHFIDTATMFEQLIRIIRALIGFYLVKESL